MVKFTVRVEKAFEERYGENIYQFLDDLPYSMQHKIEFLMGVAQDEGFDKGHAMGSDTTGEKSFDDGYNAALDDIIGSIQDMYIEK